MEAYPDFGIWKILACSIRNPGKFCLWNLECRALESRIELTYPTGKDRNPAPGILNPWNGIQNAKTVLYSLT